MLVSFVGLLALWWPLAHPGPEKAAARRFQSALGRFGEEETRLLVRQRSLDKDLQEHKISKWQWGRRVQLDLIPGWEAAEARLAGVQLPQGSRTQQLQGAIIDYADKKRFALDLLADAARTNDNDKQVWGEQVMAHDYAMARHIAQMIQDPH